MTIYNILSYSKFFSAILRCMCMLFLIDIYFVQQTVTLPEEIDSSPYFLSAIDTFFTRLLTNITATNILCIYGPILGDYLGHVELHGPNLLL